jgi:predicted dehydrogenase
LHRVGKHVLCEKPATSNAVELELVLEAARRSGCAFMEAMRPMKTPCFERGRAVLADLGPVWTRAVLAFRVTSLWSIDGISMDGSQQTAVENASTAAV